MKLFLILLFYLPLTLLSQDIPFQAGGKHNGMGNSSMALSQVWSVNYNTAGIANLKQAEIGIYYTNRFLMQELSSQSFVAVLPSKFGNWGVEIDHFGYQIHNETQIGLAYAKTLNKYLSLGVKFDYLNLHQEEVYGNISTILAEVGVLSHPYESIYLGFYVYNPSLSKYNTVDDFKAPTILSFGGAYTPDPLVNLTIQVDKPLEHSATYKLGVEFNLKDALFLRTGVNISPNAYFLGLAYYFKNIRMDFAFSYQNTLGVSPAGSMSYAFK
ncbi:MAG: hypothetical protein JXR60_10020 [Bacteroidales bacterium]|nr:hypothetical protein [Bacteroidales bacterium]